MIHAKLMLFDDETAILGSANLSIFSLQKAGELDLLIRDSPGTIATLRDVIARRIAGAEKVTAATQLARYNRILAALQQQHQKWNPN
jgi:phosphatidylserine/phosphatidylglycerophosphate/cardiolipin synthase-like enzyme